jgi:hypothetical protein
MGGLQCTKDVAGAYPELLLCVNEPIKWTRNDYVADWKGFMSLMEIHFPRTSLSTNAHSDICRAKYEMEMMGAFLMELGIERTVSYHSLLSIIMCLITSYHGNAIPYMRFAWCFMIYVLCSSLYNPCFTEIPDWEVQERKTGEHQDYANDGE